jgi:hypothetical protein
MRLLSAVTGIAWNGRLHATRARRGRTGRASTAPDRARTPGLRRCHRALRAATGPGGRQTLFGSPPERATSARRSLLLSLSSARPAPVTAGRKGGTGCWDGSVMSHLRLIGVPLPDAGSRHTATVTQALRRSASDRGRGQPDAKRASVRSHGHHVPALARGPQRMAVRRTPRCPRARVQRGKFDAPGDQEIVERQRPTPPGQEHHSSGRLETAQHSEPRSTTYPPARQSLPGARQALWPAHSEAAGRRSRSAPPGPAPAPQRGPHPARSRPRRTPPSPKSAASGTTRRQDPRLPMRADRRGVSGRRAGVAVGND